MASRRLNLTLPEHFDDLLGSLAVLSGRSKASYVLDALKWSTPYFQRDLRALQRGKNAGQVVDEPAATSVMPGEEGRAGGAVPVQSAQRRMPAGLNREGKRAWEKKYGKGVK